jgi:hypothetical protein
LAANIKDMKFSEIKFKEHGQGGDHAILRFRNGYGLSIARTANTYGGKEGLYEAALLNFYGEGPDDWDLVYNDGLGFNDVKGCLTEKEVELAIVIASHSDSAKCHKDDSKEVNRKFK